MGLPVGYTNREKSTSNVVVDIWSYSQSEFRWVCGMEYPTDIKTVDYIAADVEELEYIQRNFINIPQLSGFCIWEGEMANFIHTNLKHLTKK